MTHIEDTIDVFLSRLFVGQAGEVELAWSTQGRDAVTKAKHYPTADTGALAKHAAKLNLGGCNMYFIPTCLRPGLYDARAGDDDVISAPCLWVDIDEPDKWNTAASRLQDCAPTAIVFTSKGRGHLYWQLQTPIMAKDARRLNQRIVTYLGGDPTAVNPARLMRLPSTQRWATKKKPTVGPIHLRAGSCLIQT